MVNIISDLREPVVPGRRHIVTHDLWGFAVASVIAYVLVTSITGNTPPPAPAHAQTHAPAQTTHGHVREDARTVPLVAHFAPPKPHRAPAPATWVHHLTQALQANPGVLIAPPSVSVAVIAHALRFAPFAGETWAGKSVAQYIYDASKVLGLDPAVFLAIIHHESQYGTVGMATSTRGSCNIRPIGDQPQINNYRLYDTWQAGVDHCLLLLSKYGKEYGHNDITSAIYTWAPSSENDVNAYVSDVRMVMDQLYKESL